MPARIVAALSLVALLAACAPSPVPTPAMPTVAAPRTTPTPTTDPAAAPDATPTPVETRGLLTTPELAQRINDLLADRAGRYSIVVIMPDRSIEFRNRANAQIEAASLYKLAIMVELYAEREAGQLSFDQTIQLQPAYFLEDTGESFSIGDRVTIAVLLDRMITASSNVAAAALLARVGNTTINATMQRLGLTSTEIRWMPGGAVSAGSLPRPTQTNAADEPIYNATSASDMALLFQELLAGEVVSPAASAEMLALLADQLVNDRLPALLPAGTVVAHKTGNLPGTFHDVGVIYTPDGPAIVAVLTDEVDEFEAVQFMALLGALVYFSPR